METIKLLSYFGFGYNYHILLNGSGNNTIKDFCAHLDTYRGFINNLNLNVTKSSLSLQNIKEDFDKIYKLNKGKKKNEIVPKDLHSLIVGKIKKADPTLDAELNIKTAFLLKEKRISTEILTRNIGKLFSENVFMELPEIAKYDFTESGLCIAFERFTAAAFHALRGTEDVLKLYYTKLLSKVPLETQTWGNFHAEIDKEIKANSVTPLPSEELMINLDNIRKYYRNKTQHPQLIYSSDDAQDLLFNCIKAVNQMYQDLFSRDLIMPLPF